MTAYHAVIESVRGHVPSILATEIKYASEIERMTVRRAPLPAYAPGSVEGQMYSALWSEIAARIGIMSPPNEQQVESATLAAPSEAVGGESSEVSAETSPTVG